jgi:hypothetical protein
MEFSISCKYCVKSRSCEGHYSRNRRDLEVHERWSFVVDSHPNINIIMSYDQYMQLHDNPDPLDITQVRQTTSSNGWLTN